MHGGRGTAPRLAALLLIAGAAWGLPPLAVAQPASEALIAASRSAVEVIAGTSIFEGVAVAAGEVATPCHRLGGTAPPYAVRQGAARLPAELVAADEDRDVCLLRVPGLGAAPARMGRTRDSGTLVGLHGISLLDGLVRTGRLDIVYMGRVTEGLYLGLVPSVTSPAFPWRDGMGVHDSQGLLLGLVVMEAGSDNPRGMSLPVEWIAQVQERRPRPPAELGTVPWMNQARLLDAKRDAAGLLQNNLRWTEARPLSAWAWNNLGNAYMLGGTGPERGRNGEAAYQKAVELDPRLAQAWNNLGNVYAQTRRSPLAIEAYRTATRADPSYSVAWRNLGELLRKNGQREQAIEALQLAARSGTGSDRALALNALAFIYGEGPQAIQALQEAVNADPRFVLAWKNLGAALEKAGDRPRAITAYEIALRIDPRDAGTWTRLGDAYTWAGKSDAALQAYRAATGLDPDNGTAWKWQGMQYFKRGDFKQAASAFDEALRHGESNAQVYELLGEAQQKDGQNDKAEASYLKAIELAPLKATPSARLADLYRQLGRADEGLRLAERAVQIDPKDAVAWDVLGTSRVGKGQVPQSVEAYQRAVALDPQMTTGWINLGIQLNELRRLPEAKDALERALRIAPDNRAALTNLGVTHIRARDFDAAIGVFERLDDVKPPDPLVLANLCSVYRRAGRAQDALRTYDRLKAVDAAWAARVYETELKGLPGAVAPATAAR